MLFLIETGSQITLIKFPSLIGTPIRSAYARLSRRGKVCPGACVSAQGGPCGAPTECSGHGVDSPETEHTQVLVCPALLCVQNPGAAGPSGRGPRTPPRCEVAVKFRFTSNRVWRERKQRGFGSRRPSVVGSPSLPRLLAGPEGQRCPRLARVEGLVDQSRDRARPHRPPQTPFS